ncbi:hypothetical protein BRADI_4g13356v3 [Brachypodium distachyon]|uniref:Uncharacterized protein n=1 Tax=Brachypodium distachyon TaxID=15368 RepID=A0A0Q3H2V6_BRADI|nr:hypothetical protein BRADI_4g13356v3 [Brachypodium distachyon]
MVRRRSGGAVVGRAPASRKPTRRGVPAVAPFSNSLSSEQPASGKPWRYPPPSPLQVTALVTPVCSKEYLGVPSPSLG